MDEDKCHVDAASLLGRTGGNLLSLRHQQDHAFEKVIRRIPSPGKEPVRSRLSVDLMMYLWRRIPDIPKYRKAFRGRRPHYDSGGFASGRGIFMHG